MSRKPVAAVVLSLGLHAIGCSDPAHDVPDAALTPDAGPDADLTVPVLRYPVNMPDDQLAQTALQLLGAPIPGAVFRCQECHSITNAHVRSWGTQSDAAYPCLTEVDLH